MSPTPKTVIIDILHVSNWLQGRIADLLRDQNLSLQQAKVLAILAGEPEQCATVKTIRDKMQDPMSNVSRLLNKLMEKGFIRKEHGSEDQRVVYIHLTPSGDAARQLATSTIDQGLDALCHLTEDELRDLDRVLNRLKNR